MTARQKVVMKRILAACIKTAKDIKESKIELRRGKFLDAETFDKNGKRFKRPKVYPACAVGWVLYRAGYTSLNEKSPKHYRKGLNIWEEALGSQNTLLANVYSVNDASIDFTPERMAKIGNTLDKACIETDARLKHDALLKKKA